MPSDSLSVEYAFLAIVLECLFISLAFVKFQIHSRYSFSSCWCHILSDSRQLDVPFEVPILVLWNEIPSLKW